MPAFIDDISVAVEILSDDVSELVAGAFHLEGKHDQGSHGRDKPDTPKSSSGSEKSGSDFKVGKKLKITHAFVHKNRPIGTTVAISGDGRSKVVFTGGTGTLNGIAMGPYTHYYRKSVDDDQWKIGASFSKAKAYEWFKDESDLGTVWHEPASENDDNDDNMQVDEPTAEPLKTTKSAGPSKSTKSVSSTGSPLKITHGLVHKAHGEPGTILTENGAGDKRVVWDGDKYRLQRKTESGSWTTEKTAIKSKAYVEINAYDNDWRVPTGGNGAEAPSTSAIEPTKKPQLVETPAAPTPVAAPLTAAQPTSTEGYTKVGFVPVQGALRYRDPEGNFWMVKATGNGNKARSEALASKLYARLGVKTPQTDVVALDAKNFPNASKPIGVQSFVVEGVTNPGQISNADFGVKESLWNSFTFDLWLGNTKTAKYEGLTLDKNGDPVHTDMSDTLGLSSKFNDTITMTDVDEMRSPYLNNNAGSAYASMDDAYLIDGLQKIKDISPEEIDELVDGMGFGAITRESLKTKLKSRRQSLLDLYSSDMAWLGAKSPKPTVPIGPIGKNASSKITTPAPTPEVKPEKTSAASASAVSPKSMDDLTFVVKEKKGAVFSDKSNLKWLVTPSQSENYARNQFLTANLYNFAGVNVESTDVVAIDPVKLPNTSATVGVKTLYNPGVTGVVSEMKNSASARKAVNENFAIDAWLGNWDVVGLGYENLSVDKDGVVRRTNIGGSLLYRANGTPKGAAFGNTVGEIDSLRNPHVNPASAKVFADVTDDDIRAGVAKLEKLSPATIDFVVEQSGFTGAEATKLKNTLKARRQDLINKYGSNAPKPAATPNTPATSTQPTASYVFGGPKTYTPSQKAKVQSIFAKHNLKWHNKTDAIYDAAHEVSTTHPDLTMGDALDIMDQSLQKKSGNPFRTKVEKFLKTKAGKQHALTKGGSASLGGTAPKVSPVPTAAPQTKTTGNKFVDHGGALPKVLSRTTAGILQQRMNEATPPPWTAKQRDSLKTYTGGSYTSINKCARGVAPCTPAMKAHVDNIKAAMKPSTDDVMIYRKTNAKSFGLESPADVTSLVGKTIGDDGVISTSIKSNIWSGQLHLEIEAPKGSMMAWVQPISVHPGEDEMVVAPGTYYEVISVEQDPYYTDTYRVKLRIIPGSDAQSREQAEKLKTQQAIAALKAAKEGAK